MEEVSFSWILYTVSLGSHYIPVLETYIFKEEKLFCGYLLNDDKLIRKSFSEAFGISQYLNDLISRLSIKNKLRRLSEKISCISTKNTRDFVNYKELKELSASSILISKITKVQLTKSNYFREIKIFVFSLVYSEGTYESTFQERRESSLVPCRVKNFYEKAKDIANLLIAYVHAQRFKKIVDLKLELISDDDFALWILDIPQCFLVESEKSQLSSIENFKEVDYFTQIKSFDYFELPKISSPDVSNFSIEEDSESFSKEDVIDNIGLARRNSIFKRDAKKKKVDNEEDNDKFNDFVEILSKTYAKFGVKGTSKHVSQDDIDKEFKRIYGMLSPDHESSRKQSQTSVNFTLPNSPPLFHKRHRHSNAPSLQNSRKASQVINQKIPSYRIRILKTLKDN